MTAPPRLGSITAALASGTAIPASDVLWMLSLERQPGQRSVKTIVATARRDQWFRAAAAKYFAGLSRPKQAAKLHEGFIRYRDSAWRRESNEAECPARHHGRVTGFYWQILKARDRAISRKTVHQIISH